VLNAFLRWPKSPSSNVNAYSVAWSLNGAAAAVVQVPQSAAGDASGYQTDFNSGNPSTTLKSGDVVGATVASVDTVDNLSSAPLVPTPATVTEPQQAPDPPPSATLTLT